MNRRDFLKLLSSGLLASLLPLPSNSYVTPIAQANRWIPNIPSSQFGFLAFGDMGTGWKIEYDLVKLMAQSPVNLYPAVLLLGDLLYPSAKAELIQTNLTLPLQPLAERGFRFFPVWGNHDWIEQKAQFVKEYFVAPNYYTFTIGQAQFWALNSNEFDQVQANWLSNSLASSNSPWKIVMLHHSPYSSGNVHHSNQHLIKNLCPILSKYKVDLCLSGHNHLYERSERMGNTIYLTSGGGSASLHKYNENADFSRAMVKSCHHFIRVVGNNSYLSLQAIDLKGQIFDEFTLHK